MDLGREKRTWSRTWPFALLCALDASRWLIEGAFPATGSSLWTEAAGCLGAAVCLLAWATLRPANLNGALRRSSSVNLIIAVATVVSGAALAAAVAGRPLNANNVTLALALCPVVIAVVVSAGGRADGADLTGLLWPGLAGVAGLLLLVPEPSFGAWRPWIGMMAMPLLIGGAAGAYSAISDEEPECPAKDHRPAMAAGLACAAGLLGALAWLRWRAGTEQAFTLPAAALDGGTAVLTLFALVRLGPVRWSAQFLLVPLLGLAEGVVFLRPLLDWRSYAAFGLLALSAFYQWMALAGSADPAIDNAAEAGVPEQ